MEPSPLRRRRSRAELRSILIAAGSAILIEEGLTNGVGDLTLTQAYDRLAERHGIRVTNASVIGRIWAGVAEYRTDVLMAVASSIDLSKVADQTKAALAPALASLDTSTPESRLAGLSEVSRLGGRAAVDAIVGSPDHALWIGIWVLGLTGGGTEVATSHERVRQVLVAGADAAIDGWEEVVSWAAEFVGIRPRPPYSFRQFALAVSSLIEGALLFRPTVAPEQSNHGTALSPIGQGVHALVAHFFELDPAWRPA
jgi:hypothetical protein